MLKLRSWSLSDTTDQNVPVMKEGAGTCYVGTTVGAVGRW